MRDDEFTPEEWAEAEQAAAEIEREMREHPIANSLPRSRALALTERIVDVMREHGSDITVDDVMALRSAFLDEEARRMEHRRDPLT